MFWKSDLDVDVQTFSTNHIDAIVNQRVDNAWRFTGFYEDPNTANQENSWGLLRALSHQFNLPWVCMGDFNEILLANEKMGWLDRPNDKCRGLGMLWIIVT